MRGAAPDSVTIPAETANPATSDVLVSGRTRMTGSPLAARRSALSESKAARPTAIPADAPVPRPTGRSTSTRRLVTSALKSKPFKPPQGFGGVISPSLTKSIANRSAACGVRFAERVCKIHNLPSRW